LTTERTPTLNIEWGQINPKAGGGCNIDSGQNDPKATQGLIKLRKLTYDYTKFPWLFQNFWKLNVFKGLFQAWK